MLAMENLSLDYVPDPESAQTLVDALMSLPLIVKSENMINTLLLISMSPLKRH